MGRGEARRTSRGSSRLNRLLSQGPTCVPERSGGICSCCGVSIKRALKFYPRNQSRVPHISLVFREMWDTTGLPLKPVRVPQLHTGALRSHQRCPDFLLRGTNHGHVCGFSQGKPHEVAQRHQPRQETRDTWAENDGQSPSTAFRSGLTVCPQDEPSPSYPTLRSHMLPLTAE
jgi:hypothetical protein